MLRRQAWGGWERDELHRTGKLYTKMAVKADVTGLDCGCILLYFIGETTSPSSDETSNGKERKHWPTILGALRRVRKRSSILCAC